MSVRKTRTTRKTAKPSPEVLPFRLYTQEEIAAFLAVDIRYIQKIRRSIQQAEEAGQSPKEDPLHLLKAYQARGGLDKARAEKWIEEINKDRKRWKASSGSASTRTF